MKYCLSREVYRFSQQQFLNANFAWNQDEVPQNSRYAERFFYSSLLSAQSGSCQTNQLRSSSLLFGTLSHGAHEPISVVLRTSFLDAPAYDFGHSFAKIDIPCTIYLSLNSYPSYIYQHRSTDLLLGCTFLQYTTHKCYLCDDLLPFLSIKNSNILIQ